MWCVWILFEIGPMVCYLLLWHTNIQIKTDTQTDTQTGFIPGVNIYNNRDEMTEYKNKDFYSSIIVSLLSVMFLLVPSDIKHLWPLKYCHKVLGKFRVLSLVMCIAFAGYPLIFAVYCRFFDKKSYKIILKSSLYNLFPSCSLSNQILSMI